MRCTIVNCAHHVSFALAVVRTRSSTPRCIFPDHPLITSFFLQSHGDCRIPPNPRTADGSGRVVVYGRSQALSPTPSLISAAQMLLQVTMHQGGQVFAQHGTPPVSSEVDERQSTERLASLLLMQRRKTSAVPAKDLSLHTRKPHVKLSSLSKFGENFCDTLIQAEGEQGHEKRTGDTSHK